MESILVLTAIIMAMSANATTWHVGATQTYTAMSQVKPLVQNNDTVLIDAGVYLNDPVKWDKKNLYFKGIGNSKPIMRWNAGDIPNGKGIWVFELAGTSDNPKIENIVFDGARVSDGDGGNGAGIRFQAKDITIKNCVFKNCQNGILEGNGSITNSNVVITDTEFDNNGYEVIGNATHSGYEHHLYISASADTFWLQNCYLHNPRGEANSVKTRAQRSFILYNKISEENGQGSWEINIAQGGLSIIMGNIIVQGVNSINHGMISYDAATNAIQDFYFINNTVINKYVGNNKYFNISPTSGINTFKVYNNLFASNAGSSNTFMAGTVSVLDSLKNWQALNYNSVGFQNPSADDYYLPSGSSIPVDKGTNVGVASNGFSLTPKYYYNMGANLTRTTFGSAIDLGAFEYMPTVSLSESSSLSNEFTVYVNDKIHIKSHQSSNMIFLSITDITGRIIYESSVLKQNEISIDKSIFLKGLYVVTIVNEQGKKVSRKIIID